MDITNIIIKPYITEKTNELKNNPKQVITFIVNPKANKNHVYLAFKAIYNVEPLKINILNKKPTAIKTATKFPGFTKFMKIAYITLPLDAKIALTADEQKEAMEQQKEEAKIAKKAKKADVVETEKKSTKKTTKTNTKESKK